MCVYVYIRITGDKPQCVHAESQSGQENMEMNRRTDDDRDSECHHWFTHAYS